jgi:RND family efflux transporter MFP subunit
MIRTKREHLRLAAPILLAFVAAFLAGCGGRHETTADDGGAPMTVPVLVMRPSSASGAFELPGRVEAREEVTLASRVSGRVTALPVPDGGSFREGTPLARFDAPEAREGLAAAEASWSAARATLDLARRQEARFESLYVAKVAALHELELVRADRERAEAAERGAAAAASERRAGVEIGAPFAGVVVRRRVDPGAEVSPGTPLLDIRSREIGLVVAAVPEQGSSALQGPAAIQVGDGAWRPAKLVSADGMIDPVSRTRTARFRPLDGKPLEAGAFARVRLGAEGGAAGGGAGAAPGPGAAGAEWLIPSRALVTRGALNGVFVLRDGRVSLRWLRLGRQAGDDVLVLAGLDPGDSVALDPSGLVDGRRAEAAR